MSQVFVEAPKEEESELCEAPQGRRQGNLIGKDGHNLASQNLQFYVEDKSSILQVTTIIYDTFYLWKRSIRDHENILEEFNFYLSIRESSPKK